MKYCRQLDELIARSRIACPRARPGSRIECSARQPNAGTTIVELLTALGVISLLTAVLLPGIHQVRERARSTTCANHLRQLVMGAQAHEAAHRHLPRSEPLWVDDQQQLQPSVSIHVHLLPFLDQIALYNQFDFLDVTVTPDEDPPRGFSDANTAVLHQVVPIFVCPSDHAPSGATNYRACVGAGAKQSFQGDGFSPFAIGKSLSAADFADGLSNTALLSERVVGDYQVDAYDPWRDVFLVQAASLEYDDQSAWINQCSLGVPYPPLNVSAYSFLGAVWFRGGPRNTSYNHILGPNSSVPDCADTGPYPDGGPGIYNARSQHPGGVNLALADGAVRFIADAVDLRVWRAIATRNGREVIDNF